MEHLVSFGIDPDERLYYWNSSSILYATKALLLAE